MDNGLYAVEFRTNNDHGNGIITIVDGSINGGDSGYYYQGRIRQTGKELKLNLSVKQYVSGYVSAFGSVGQFSLDLTGSAHEDGITAQFHGSIIGSPSQHINITAKKIEPII